MVTLKTSLGTILIELDHERAPETSANFAQYVRDGFFDDTIFHRVIDGFMIQGGGLTADMQQKPTREPIQNEADNGLANEVGTVAMARTNDPHSATAQFFINVADNSFLNHRSKDAQGWAMPSLAGSSRAWTWSRPSRAWPPATAPAIRTCPWRPSPSSRPPSAKMAERRPSLFISDLHLRGERPDLLGAFADWARGPARAAGQVCILCGLSDDL